MEGVNGRYDMKIESVFPFPCVCTIVQFLLEMQARDVQNPLML
jgi:hypothetical protein